MRRILALLIVVSLLSAFPVFTQAEEADQKPPEAQSASLALACWLGGYDGGELSDLICWDACGWYAAYQERITGERLLREDEVQDYLSSIGYRGPLDPPAPWEEYGIVNRVIGAGSFVYYDFRQNRTMFNAMIGIDTELSTVMADDQTAVTTITVHRGENVIDHVFRFTFEASPNENSRFPYRVVKVEKGLVPAKMDEKLNFTWELLMEQNSLSCVLSLTDGVRIYNPNDNPEKNCTWIFNQKGHTAILGCWDGYVTGTYGFYSFDTLKYADGKTRASIGYVSYDPLEETYDETYISDYLKDIIEFRYLYETDEEIWMDGVLENGDREQVAVDKGTLFLREISYTYDGAYPASVTRFDYTTPVPGFAFMQGWDKELRTVTAIWEETDGQSADLVYRTENLQIPMDWEYLPYVVRWGEYTAYLNPRYTGTYAYPGDIYDYTVYFTAVKG